MFDLFVEVLRINQNVVEVNYQIYLYEISEDVVDKMLKGGRCIAEAKGHNCVLEASKSSSHCCQIFVSFSDSNQIVGSSKIDLREMSNLVEKCEEVRHWRNRVSVLLRYEVEFPIVHTETQRVVLLRDEEYW